MNERVVLFAVALGACTWSCSLVLGWNGLSDGENAREDSGASSDAASSDGSPAPTGDAGASLCTSSHALCDDFTPETFPDLSRWTTVEQPGGASAARVTDAFVSPPAGFRATSAGTQSAALVKGIAGRLTALTCEFSIKPNPAAGENVVFRNFTIDVTPEASADVDWYVIWFSSVEPNGAVTALWSGKGEGVGGGAGGPPVVPPRQWTRVRIDLTFGSPSTARVFYNGDPAGSMTLTRFPLAHTDMSLRFGAITEDKAVGGTVDLDDIVCDVVR